MSDFERYVSGLPAGVFECIRLAGAIESIQRPPAFILGTLPGELCLPMLGELATGPLRCYRL